MPVNNLNRLAFLNGGLNNYISKHEALQTYQDNERTNDMLYFSAHIDSPHSIKIINETNDNMTVRIGERNTGKLVHIVSFPKKHNIGVIWNYRDYQRLWNISFTPNYILS